MSISKHIIELLHKHDCVIIPGFGAFLTKSIPASHDNNVFSPPKKSVTFNGMLKENDGLLANEISAKENISYNASLKQIKKEVKALLSSLKSDKVEIDNTGTEKEIKIQREYDENLRKPTVIFCQSSNSYSIRKCQLLGIIIISIRNCPVIIHNCIYFSL